MKPLPPFDELKWLAKHDPKALDKLQYRYTHDAIQNTDKQNQQQLICIQHNLMMRLNRCHSAYERCDLAMTVLTDKLNHLSSVINQAGGHLAPATIIKPLWIKRKELTI
ncbi:DUF3135 domain-containing protein [Shewanella surugensis]|uniref:DUF3135 domain-containing protein n=1 Tax=Shewanella surugensis TaxID=212020 RepID=A0ABT0L7E1_9GAMM|nr:DUF3135 domain-containing protein [Shewanella surugensis]MCL1123614.1 DUF3135 domain-containing protein [Shewanella surugensis]